MNKKIIKSLTGIFKSAHEVCLVEIKCCLCNILKINYLLIKFFATMQKASNCASGAQQVATTMEAAQGVPAQNSIGAEQSAQLNPQKVTVRHRWTTITNDTDHRPVGIIHYFTPSGEYIKSVMKTTLHKWGYTTYLKSDGSVSYACFWMNTRQEKKKHEFNLMCPDTMDHCLEAFWAKVMECYDHRSAKMTYDGTRIPVQYLTTEVKATHWGYANPLF